MMRRRFEQETAVAQLGMGLRWGGLFDCEVTPDSRDDRPDRRRHGRGGCRCGLRPRPGRLPPGPPGHLRCDDLRGSASCRVLHYQCPSTLSFAPTVFVDIADHLAGKLAALACHRSQVEQSFVVEPDVVAAQARYWGARLGSPTPRRSCRPGWCGTWPRSPT